MSLKYSCSWKIEESLETGQRQLNYTKAFILIRIILL
jgi:hypothetical protein